jgi:lysophospholipase L1-like esterase
MKAFVIPARLVAIAVSLIPFAAVATSQDPPVRILPLGDSLTSGLSTSPVQGAYRNQLHTLLTAAGYSVDFLGTLTDDSNPDLPDRDHQGLGSARIDQIRSQFSGWIDAAGIPDVVLLLIGTNDFWQGYDVANAAARLESLIADIVTRCPHSKIIVSTLPLRTDSALIEAQQSSFNRNILGIVLRQSALGRQVTMVDLHPALTAADINGDGVHPNATGFRKMAEAWFPAITSVISPKGTPNPPVISQIIAPKSGNPLQVVFSKPVADDSIIARNFTLSAGVAVTGATLDASTKRVASLTTAPITPGIVHHIRVSEVYDRTSSQTSIAPESMASFMIPPIMNGGFEQSFDGWKTFGNVDLKSAAPYSASEGSRLAAFNSSDSTPNGWISQEITTTPGATYELGFDLAAIGFNNAEQTIELVVQGTSALVSETFSVRASGAGITRWNTKKKTFTADKNTTAIRFRDVSSTSASIDLVLDHIRVDISAGKSLAVTSSPASGASFTLTPADLAGQGIGIGGMIRRFADNTTVTITAPIDHLGLPFLRWQRNGVDLSGSQPELTVSMESDITLAAVYGTNLAPNASDDVYSTTAGKTLIVPARGVLSNDEDPENGTLSAVIQSTTPNGIVNINANGGFTYTPAVGFIGTDSFSYRVSDGVSFSDVATTSIVVRDQTTPGIDNGGFEADFTGWTRSGSVTVQNKGAYLPSEGSKLAAFNAGQELPNGVLSRVATTKAGADHVLSFDMATYAFNTSTQKLEVRIDGATTAVSKTFTLSGTANGSIRWTRQTIPFTAQGSSVTLTFRDVSATTAAIDLLLDRVQIEESVREYSLAIESTPFPGVNVTISPPGSDSASLGATPFSRKQPEGTIVNLSAPSVARGGPFLKWLLNGETYSTERQIHLDIQANATITAVYGSNPAPYATTDVYHLPSGAPLTVSAPGLLANDSDPDGDPLNAILETAPTRGQLVLQANGGFTYTPEVGFSGTDSFTYRASDGQSTSESTKVTLHVAALAPGMLENGSFEFGDTGWSMTGNRIIVTSSAPYIPTDGGKLLVMNGGQTQPNAVLTQRFVTLPGQAYQLDLDLGIVGATTAEQRLKVELIGSTTLRSVIESIRGIGTSKASWSSKKYAFIADSSETTLRLSDISTSTSAVDLLLDNIRLATGNATALTVDASLSGVDINIDPLDLVGQTSGTTRFSRFYPSGSIVSLTAPTIHGAGRFVKWTLNGIDHDTQNTTRLTVGSEALSLTAIYAVNQPPTAVADRYECEREQLLTVTAPGVLQNDVDLNSDPLQVELVDTTARGSLSLSPDGGFTYRPEPGFIGNDRFTYRAKDGGLTSAPVTVTLEVKDFASGNLVNGSFEDGETGWTVSGNRVVSGTSAPYIPTDGVKLMVANGGNVTPNAVISQTFATSVGKTYVIRLDVGVVGGVGVQQRLRINIDGKTQLLSQLETVTSASASRATWVSKNFSFVADGTSATLSLLDQSSSGNLRDLLIDNVRCSIRLDRTLTVSSLPVDGLTVSASPADMTGNGSGITRFTRTYENGSSVILTAPATAGDLPFLRWERGGILIGRNREITILMDRDQDVSAVYGINRAPVAADDTYQTVQDTSLTISPPSVLFNDADPDGDPITAELGTPPTHGTLDFNANGGFVYTPSAGFTGIDTFTYRVSDGALASAYQTVTITIRSAPKDYLANGSFEQQAQGWTITGNHLVVASSTPYLASDESSLIVLNAGQTVPNAVLRQTIATTPGASYVLAFEMGAVGTSGLNQRLEVGINGTSQRTLGTETITAIGTSAAVWSTKSFTFTADATETTITLIDRSTTGTNVDLLLDNVRVLPVGTHTLVIDGPSRGTEILVSTADLQRNLGGVTRMHRYFSPQTNVAVEAPAEHQGRPFQKWTLGGADHAFTRSTTLVMDRDQALTAVYESLPELLVNGSFEDALNGWVRTGNADVRGSSPYLATDGKQLLGFNTAQSTPNGIISQTVPTVPGGVYQLSFDAGALGYNTQLQKLEVTVTGNASLLSRTVSIQGTGNGSIRWQPQAFSFTADGTDAILRFRDVSSTSSSIDLLLDKVRLSGPPVRHQISIASAPVNGLTIGINVADADGLTGGATPLTRTYFHGTNVTLEAPADADSIPFSRWTKNGVFFSSNRSTTATIDGSHAFTAVFAANNTPVATPDAYAVNHNTALEVPSPGVLANDTDAESAPLTARLATPPTNGSLTLNANGSFRYLPRTGFEGEDSFAYVASDGIADSASSTVTLRVAPAPIILFTNGSFESGLTGWNTGGSAGTVKVKAMATASDGANCIEFNSGNTLLDGSLSQGFTTTPGVTYTVRFDMGVISFNTNSQRIQITAVGGKTLADQTFSLAGISGGKTNWSTRSVSFVADSKFTTLTFRDRSLTGSALDLLLDKVSVTSSDPSGMRSLNVIADPSATIAIGVTPTDPNGATGGATPLSLTYPNGTDIVLTAPASANGFPFVKWLRNGVDHSTSPTASVRMDADQTMTAVYSASGPPAGSAFTNGSFESGLTGWIASGSSEAVKVNAKITGTNGSNLIEFNSNNSPTDGAVTQTFATLPGATYQVRFDMGVLAFNTQQQRMDVTVSGVAPITTKSYSMNGMSGGTVKWTNQTFRFVADGSTATLTLRDRSSTTSSIDLLLDHVRVSMVSPAGAGADLIANGSFENDFSGWNVTGSTGIEMYGTSAATHGSKILSFNVGNLPSGGTASQSFDTVPGTTYWIGYDVAANGLEPKTASVQLTVRGASQLLSRSTSVIGPNNYRILWSTPQASTFVADSTRTTVTFTDTTADGGGVDLLLDWVRVHPLPKQTIIAPTASVDAGSTNDSEPSAITESATPLEPPTLQGVPGDMRIIAHAPIPGIYVLETSIDLEHWVPQQEIHAESSGVIEFEDRQPARSRSFYRIAKK